MSLNPSNAIAARANPGKTMFPNLARHPHASDEVKQFVDENVVAELTAAGIKPEGPAEWLRDNKEVPAAYIGSLCMWSFHRAWYYWIANGPGIPADRAEEFHKTWGTQCRVDGHCGCPSPLEWRHGFAVGMYHIDTQEGLNAFAQLLKSIYVESPDKRAQQRK
jgi:hypothetical protein